MPASKTEMAIVETEGVGAEDAMATTNLDYPSPEMIEREDTLFATFFGAVNTKVVKGVSDLESIDARLKVRRMGGAAERHARGLQDPDLGC